MKINISLLSVSPDGLYLCVHKKGYSNEIVNWVKYHNFNVIIIGDYININGFDNCNIIEIFNIPSSYEYMDGFSPNTNKELHVGHLSNFIISCAINNSISAKPLFIRNNTKGITPAFESEIFKLMEAHDYRPKIYDPKSDISKYLRNQKILGKYYNSILGKNCNIDLIDGEGAWKNTKCINIQGEIKVCIKSDNSTSYLFQDLLMIESIGKSILYITGKEQKSHFNLLSKYNPNFGAHVPLGHVQVDGKKLSSRDGNVLLVKEFVSNVNTIFKGNHKLAWNAIVGALLSYDIKKDKKLDLNTFSDPKNNVGVYLSYTIARLKNAGLDFVPKYNMESRYYFNDKITEFIFNKCKVNLKLNVFLNRLKLIAKDLNSMYEKGEDYIIKNLDCDSPVRYEYENKAEDLLAGMNLLGMHYIGKI